MRRALHAFPTGCHKSVKIRAIIRHGLCCEKALDSVYETRRFVLGADIR